MDTIISNPGLYHISEKIFQIYFSSFGPSVCFVLRLVNSSMKSIFDNPHFCLKLLKIQVSPEKVPEIWQKLISELRAQSFTLLKAVIHQVINGGFAFSGYPLPRNKRFLIKFFPSKTLQNLLYFYNKKTHVVFFVFHFEQLYIFH